ncbi:histidine kinase [Virgibacillus sp. W0181]|uniref:histidine kinase n=1 Tax=Virgibacillus sp. W0181 TaxID=3391581 RepID=UPI003F47AD02
MEKKKVRMDESILVCVYYGPNGERLIRRGHKLANMLNCPLYVLTVDKRPYDEFDAEKLSYIEQWKELSEELGVDKFILKDNEARSSVKTIKAVAHKYNVTQVIIGEAPQNRWEEITKGSFVNVLLRELLFIDIHIVAVDRTLKSESETTYEKGVRGFLQKDDKGYLLQFTKSKTAYYEGVFYKEIGTDFNNGIFKFAYGGKTYEVNVEEDRVTEDIKEPPNCNNKN